MSDPLGKRLRDEVANRRDAGHYPPGVEEELDHLYERVVARPASVDTASLHRLVSALATPFYASDAEATSRVPGAARAPLGGRLGVGTSAAHRQLHVSPGGENCLAALLKTIGRRQRTTIPISSGR